MILEKLLIVTIIKWVLILHRLVIAIATVKEGGQVHVTCEDTGRGKCGRSTRKDD